MSIFQIDAGPGSGKTYTSIMTGMYLTDFLTRYPSNATKEQEVIYKTLKAEIPKPKKIAYFAHTNTIVDELKTRLPTGSQVNNFHSAGLSLLTRTFGYQALARDRLDGFISDLTGQNLRRLPYKDKSEWIAAKKITNLLKQEYLDPTEDNLSYLKAKYPDLTLYSIPKDWSHRADQLLKKSLHPNKKVDYIDMVWMAAKHARRPIYDLGIVDESQDISKTVYVLLTRICKHLICSGDPNQAIMAFTGACEDIFQQIVEVSDGVFPLKTTFRCPPNIITKANIVIPKSVLPGPNKIPGREENISYNTFIDKLSNLDPTCTVNGKRKLNTLVMCRTNAPLIALALPLLHRRVPVKLADKDLPARLKGHLKKAKATTIGALEHRLTAYADSIRRRNNPLLDLITEDFNSSLLQLAHNCSSIKELEEKITVVCTPRPNQEAHLFATIHKAKGLEAYNCFIINPPIQSPLANQTEIGRLQETKVEFVAITRTMDNLYWVRN